MIDLRRFSSRLQIRTVPALGQSLRQVSSFYDSTIERWATQPLERLSLGQLLRFGREAQADPDRILKSARWEVPMGAFLLLPMHPELTTANARAWGNAHDCACHGPDPPPVHAACSWYV